MNTRFQETVSVPDRRDWIPDPLAGCPNYRTKHFISSGSQGVVVLADWYGSGFFQGQQKEVAVKCLSMQNQDGRRWLYESICLKHIRHCRVTAFYECFHTSTHFCIAMELVNGETLRDYISREGALGENESRAIFHDIAIGLRRIHKLDVCLRDLKADNVLYDNVNKIAKICDLGFARPSSSAASTMLGTPAYVAPEILELVSNLNHTYDGKIADIWSLGILLYYIIYKQFPFLPDTTDTSDFEHSKWRVMKNVIERTELAFPETPAVSPECQNLISQMIIKNPDHRIKIEDILTHPWLAIGHQNSTSDLINPFQPPQSNEMIISLVNSAIVDSLTID